MPVKIPPIKSQGIKSKLVLWIGQIANSGGMEIKRWVEPFMGTCAVPINIQAKSYLLGDINPHLVEFYLSVQKDIINPVSVRAFLQNAGEQLIKSGGEYYYFVRERFNNKYDPFDFLFLNRACFNGLMRFNRHGKFNVPFCRKPDRFRAAYITKICNQVKIVSDFLKFNEIKIINCDFKEFFSSLRDDDLIYCDPPYIDRYADYYSSWSDENERALFSLINASGNYFILSTWHHNDFRKNVYIEKLWHNFTILIKNHFYHVGASESNRHEMVEALVTNLPAVCSQNGRKIKQCVFSI